MGKLDDLLASLEDSDAAEAIKAEMAKLAEAGSKAARLERDLKVAKEPGLREKFPRAMAAYDKGRVTLPDDPSDDALVAFLKSKEEEYEDLGVPIPGATVPTAGIEEKGEPDPAAAFGSPVAGGAPVSRRDYVREVLDTLRTDKSNEGREKAAAILTEINVQEGFMSPKLAEIVEKLNAKPIIVR